MATGGVGSHWINRIYLGIAGMAIVSILLAAWWFGSRSPERQAKRWGLVQLQVLRQSRERILDRFTSLDQRIRVLADSREIINPNEDLSSINEEVNRALTGQDIEGLHLQRYSLEGRLLFEIRPSLFSSDLRSRRPTDELGELLDWGSKEQNRGKTLAGLERSGPDSSSDTRLIARDVASVWTRPDSSGTAKPAGILIVRFPVKDFIGANLIAAHLTPESYTFVLEQDRSVDGSTNPASVVWHFKNPRWADVYLSDTDPFVRAVMDEVRRNEAEGYIILDVPQSDGGMQREIVSTLPMNFGDRRWLMGLATPYNDAVLSTRGQQTLTLVLSGLTLAVIGAGLVLLNYQRTRLQFEAISEQRARIEDIQHNYRELFAENPTAMIILRDDASIIDLNHSAERLIGNSASESVDHQITEFFEEESIRRIWDRLRTSGQLSSMDARLIRRSDGKATLVETWGRQINESLILMVQDVEQRRDLERQIARLKRMDSVGSLASTLAHDFNNILGQVQILVSNLRADLPEESTLHGDLATIEDKIDDAALLVGNLLSFRQNIVSDVPVHPESILREFIQQQRKLLPEKIEIVDDVRGDLPSIWLTPTSLRRMLDNLVVNACDAMPNGGTLTIRARGKWIDAAEATDQLQPDYYCMIEIADTGIGMSPEMLDTIFEPFFSTKTEGKGTGLGLWTIYKIIRRIRGAIHVHSELGKGTRFTLYLARSKPTEDIDTPGLEMARPNK
ncbi:PAS domain S-box protein [bacterium]|nr:PAS domain S-box protein [bacterium]